MTINDGPPPTSFTRFDTSDLAPREIYKILIGTVVPRPIAWVTTTSPEGAINAAPYSFFNCLSADPPILALGVENWADMRFKDTAHNIRMTEEFTVNIVSDALMEAMNITAIPFPSHVNELEQAGLTTVVGTHVKCPRIAEAPVAFECRRHVGIAIGKSREIILGLVLAIHIRDDIVDRDRFHIDPRALDAVGRMGGHGYAQTRDLFDLPTMSVADWDAGHIPTRSLTPP
jgi:flavin reductase (DIM6/NTAB) family NADH-FMN oxidoreductase RutF